MLIIKPDQVVSIGYDAMEQKWHIELRCGGELLAENAGLGDEVCVLGEVLCVCDKECHIEKVEEDD